MCGCPIRCSSVGAVSVLRRSIILLAAAATLDSVLALKCVGTRDKPTPAENFPYLTDHCGKVDENGTLVIQYGEKCVEQCTEGKPSGDFEYNCTEVSSTKSGAMACTCFSGPDPECLPPAKPGMCVEPKFKRNLTEQEMARIDTSDCTKRSPPAQWSCSARCRTGYEGPEGQCQCGGLPRQDYGYDYETWCDTPSCKPISCGVPPAVEHATSLTTEEVHYESYARYVCVSPYLPVAAFGIKLKGGAFLVPCLRSGKFDVEHANFICRWDSDVVRNSPCGEPPPIQNATIVDHEGSGNITKHGEHVKYRCNEGYTADGKKGGLTHVAVECENGYYRNYEAVGCQPEPDGPAYPEKRRECHWEDAGALQREGLDTTCKGTRYEGESCTVKCSPDWYQPLPTGMEAPIPENETVPVLMICRGGVWEGKVPSCVQRDPVLHLDVYAVLRTDSKTNELCHPIRDPEDRDPTTHEAVCEPIPKGEDGSSLPSNLNVYSLEGVLVHFYKEIFFFQQELAKASPLEKEERTGYWTGDLSKPDAFPKFHVYRDVVDTVVWYRLSIKNPSSIPQNLLVYSQLGVYAAFQFGQATNMDAQKLFSEVGSVVGGMQSDNSTITIFRSKDPSYNCGGVPPSERGEKWKSICTAEERPRHDPEYAPTDSYAAFSIAGACPEKTFAEKSKDTLCQQGTHGLCTAEELKSDKEGCTYSIKEVARLSVDELTGVKSQPCGGGACKDHTDFVLNCVEEDFQRGVYLDGSQPRKECLEYVNTCTTDNSTAWYCSSGCADQEVGLPFWKGRCDPQANKARLEEMRKQFLEKASSRQEVEALTVVQDCGSLRNCDQADEQLGLSYCARSPVTGLCNYCYVKDTVDFSADRVENLFQCRPDLFSSGGYPSRKPDCRTSGELDSDSCCGYMHNCARTWNFTEDWSSCGSGDCGEGLRYRSATCPMEDKFGDCRRQLGDPMGHGVCSDTGGCAAVETCVGQRCPWVPFCEEEERGQCIPPEQGPVDSECSWGEARRYKRCSLFPPKAQGLSLCNLTDLPTDPPVTQYKRIVATRSRLDFCGNCEVGDEKICGECVSPKLFGFEAGLFGGVEGTCTNKHPFVQLQLNLTVSSAASATMVGATSFVDLDEAVATAFEESKAWFHDFVTLIDSYRRRGDEPASGGGNESNTTDQGDYWVLIVALSEPLGRPEAEKPIDINTILKRQGDSLEQKLGERLANLVEATGDSPLLALTIIEEPRLLYCPGMKVASDSTSWASCRPNSPLGLILLGVGLTLLVCCGGAAGVGVCWTKRLLCFREDTPVVEQIAEEASERTSFVEMSSASSTEPPSGDALEVP